MSLNTLDITPLKEKGLALHKAIEQAVKDQTSGTLYIPLPSEILMTQAQYDNLIKLANMHDMYASNQQLYKTKYNVMEVKVKTWK